MFTLACDVSLASLVVSCRCERISVFNRTCAGQETAPEDLLSAGKGFVFIFVLCCGRDRDVRGGDGMWIM